MQLTQARFLLRTGQEPGNAHNLQQAIELLETLLREAVRFQRVTSQIEILVLLALARFALRDERATQTLLQALALGEPEGYRQVYLDEGRQLFQPLQHCRYARRESGDHLPSLAFIEDLLEAIQRTDGALEAAAQPGRQWALEQPVGTAHAHLEDGLPVTLSARELEVLKLIAAGKSNQEISAQLYLALNTVKRHAYNIYAKLEVKKRTQAVSKARQLGFIP